MCSPSRRTGPGPLSNPAIISNSLVFPEPLGPSNERNSPCWIRATRVHRDHAPKRLLTASSRTRGLARFVIGPARRHRIVRLMLPVHPKVPGGLYRMNSPLDQFSGVPSGGERDRWFGDRVADQLARLWPMIVSPSCTTGRGLATIGGQAIKQCLRGDRLAQILVDADPHRLDHAPALAMRR